MYDNNNEKTDINKNNYNNNDNIDNDNSHNNNDNNNNNGILPELSPVMNIFVPPVSFRSSDVYFDYLQDHTF